MVKYIFAAIICLLPSVLSVVLDFIFAKSKKNLFSKYCIYTLLVNLIVFSAMFLSGFSYCNILAACSSLDAAGIFLLVALITAAMWPVIIRKSLPSEIALAYDSFTKHPVIIGSSAVISFAAVFALRIFATKSDEPFSNFAVLCGTVLALVLSTLAVLTCKILKINQNDRFKGFLSHVKAFFGSNEMLLFKKRLGLAMIVDFAFAFSVMLFIPYETYLGNTGEFVFSFSFFWWIIAVEALVYFVILLFVQLIFVGKAFNVAVTLVFGVTLAAYVQSVLMNGTMAQLDGSESTKSLAMIIINAVVWFLIVAIPIVLSLCAKKVWKSICGFGCILLIGMQATALVSLLLAPKTPAVSTRITTAGLYEASSSNNVIVFVFDRFDLDNVEAMTAKDPNVFKDLKGFTGYTDVSGSYTYTHLAIPHLLTGEKLPQYDPTHEQYSELFENSDYFNTLADNVSDFRVYADEFCVVGDSARSKLDNLGTSDGARLHSDVLVHAAQKVSVYRAAPFCLKGFFSYTSEDFNSAIYATADGSKFYLVSSRTDADIKQDVMADGITVNPEYTNGCFKFIHTNGAHNPTRLDANGNYSALPSDVLNSSFGSVKMVSEYLKALNEAGCYENTTIIITSDHGMTHLRADADDESDLSVNPIMFYKPAGVGYSEPFKMSDAPVCHADIFPTVMDAFGFEYGSENGMTLESIDEQANRTRYFYWNRFETDMPRVADNYMHVEYAINGHAGDSDNWERTGNVEHCNGWKEAFGEQ